MKLKSYWVSEQLKGVMWVLLRTGELFLLPLVLFGLLNEFTYSVMYTAAVEAHICKYSLR